MKYSQVLGIAVLLMGGIGVGVVAYQPTATPSFTNARQHWTTHRPLHYKMVVEYRSPPTGTSRCQQELDVLDERVVAVVADTCQPSALVVAPQTVSDLFASFAPIARDRTCGPNGCQCDGVVTIKASYDAEFKYPTVIKSQLQPDWRNLAYWQTRWGGEACTQIGFIENEVAILSLEPLP